MRDKTIKLTNQQLSAHLSNIRMQSKLMEAQRLIKDGKYTILPVEVHERLRLVSEELDAIALVLHRAVDTEIWQFYNNI